jgi:hypothetical protein
VAQAPIKELVWVQVDKDYYRGPTTSAGSANAGSTDLTGHVQCGKYDVLHYAFQVVMDPAYLPRLIGRLSSKNFHTALTLRCEPLSKRGTGRPGVTGGSAVSGLAAGLPEYGADFVMVVTLQCEVVFMKSPQSWRDASTPRKVQEAHEKRLAFFRKRDANDSAKDNANMVLKVVQVLPNGETQDVLTYEQLAADRGLLAAYLEKDDPNLRFIALYEDLMPREIRDAQPPVGGQNPTGR